MLLIAMSYCYDRSINSVPDLNTGTTVYTNKIHGIFQRNHKVWNSLPYKLSQFNILQRAPSVQLEQITFFTASLLLHDFGYVISHLGLSEIYNRKEAFSDGSITMYDVDL